jgi:MoxR-like ATPase
MIECARALAFLRGRDYALPEDVIDMVPDVVRHRLVLSYEALAEGLTADELIKRLMQKIRPPEKPMQAHVRVENPAPSQSRAPAKS